MGDGNLEVYTDFQYVSRKSKGKKRRSRPKIKVNADQNSDNSDAVEVDGQNVEVEISNELDDPNSNDDNTNEDEFCKINERISTDAQLKAKPQYEKAEEIYEKELLSHEENEEVKSEMDFTVYVQHSLEGETFNVRALSKHAETYELETFEKNALLIFNQEKVEGYMPRYGTEKDVQALKNTFNRFGFEVTEHKDLTKKEIFDKLDACKYLFNLKVSVRNSHILRSYFHDESKYTSLALYNHMRSPSLSYLHTNAGSSNLLPRVLVLPNSAKKKEERKYYLYKQNKKHNNT